MAERLIIDNPEELLRLQGISNADVMKKVITEFGTKAWDQFLDDITRKRDLKNISPMSRQEVMNDPAMVQKIMEIGLMPEAGILGGVKGAKALERLGRKAKLVSPKLKPSDRVKTLYAEDIELKPEVMAEISKVANMDLSTGKIHSYKMGEKGIYNHADIAVKHNMPNETTIPGFLNKKGEFLVQYQDDLVKVNKPYTSPLKQAILDTHRGADPEKVWKETGWTQDPQGKWMFRIDDSKAKLHVSKPNRRIGDSFFDANLEDILDHPELYKAYPEFKNMRVVASENVKPLSASFNGNEIWIGADTPANLSKSTLLHEINHAVAAKEGLVKGGVSPSRTAEYAPVWDDVKKQWTHPSFEDARRRYTNAAGEIYAREEEVGFKGMPGTMEKIPRKDWIVRKGMAEMSRKRK
uniref:Large polyvalent protein associated domain-containing protein n=3 Tax=viral metagenome TaxID=1070528 RepID=A0A6M3KF35_9ZZZZ